MRHETLDPLRWSPSPQSLSLYQNRTSPQILCWSNLWLAVDWKLPLTHGVAEELRLAIFNFHAIGIKWGSLQVSESTDSSPTKFAGKLDHALISVSNHRCRSSRKLHGKSTNLPNPPWILLCSIVKSRGKPARAAVVRLTGAGSGDQVVAVPSPFGSP
jgi:hypothetical protein